MSSPLEELSSFSRFVDRAEDLADLWSGAVLDDDPRWRRLWDDWPELAGRMADLTTRRDQFVRVSDEGRARRGPNPKGVVCSYCLADVGRPCVRVSGLEAEYFHKARASAAASTRTGIPQLL